MTDAQDTINTLNKQHEQIKSIIGCLCSNDHFITISDHCVAGNLWVISDLIEQAEQATNDLWEQIKQQGDSKPDAHVMMDGEPIPDLAAIKDSLPIGHSPRIEAVIKQCEDPESVRQYLREKGIYKSQLN